MIRCFALFFLALSFFSSPPAVALENAQILPQGRFSLGVKYLGGRVQDRWTGAGNREPLAQPVLRSLSFRQLAEHKNHHDATKIAAFLKTQGWSLDDEVGRYQADMDAKVQGTAVVLGYGLSSKTSVAIGVPIVRAHTRIKVGFRSASRGREFVARLADPAINFGGESLKASAELSDAVGELDANLEEYGYAPLTNWQDQGIGDIQMGVKHQLISDTSGRQLALLGGVVLPTGRVDDPDVLTDVPFGDGGFDLFTGLALDANVNSFTDGYLSCQYTHQLPFRKTIRETTAEETVFRRRTQVRYKPGDVMAAGLGTRFGTPVGVGLTTGMNLERKFGDTYRDLSADSKSYHESETHGLTVQGLVGIGYDTTRLFLAGKSSFPVITKAGYLYQFYGENTPKTNLWQADVNVFF